MFFTKTGRTVAWFCVVGGALHLGYLMSFGVSLNDPTWPKINALALTDYKIIGFGIVLGIFSEISKSLAARAVPTHPPETDDPQK